MTKILDIIDTFLDESLCEYERIDDDRCKTRGAMQFAFLLSIRARGEGPNYRRHNMVQNF